MGKSRFELVLLFAGAAALAVGLVSCGGGGDDGTGDDGLPANAVATNTTSASGSSATKPAADKDDEEVEVSMKDNIFEPKTITVAVGETVTIVAKNDGLAVHNMVVLGTKFKSEQLVMAGDESSFDVKFEKAGEYKFQCDYHVPDMVGTITVK